MNILNRFYPHLLAIFGFILVSIIYFYPVLQGKELYQSDIAQYTGMAKEQNDFRAEENSEPYWTNSAFGGMPTYQLGANYPHNYIKKLDGIIRFLPRPADYLFLYFIGFYGLLLVLRTDPLKAFIGALAFGFSTYMIIILGVGHNAKAHAIAYMPLVVAGVIMVFRRKYVAGGLLTMIAAALEISANHFQMTFYLMIILIAIAVYYFIGIIRSKDYRHLGFTAGTFAIAALLAIGTNAANLMATFEYTDFSMRGKSELSFNADGSKNETTSSMTYDYITEYSYGVAESFNLIAPRLFGGSNSEALPKDSNVHELIRAKGATEEEADEFASAYGMTYWGDQPIVAAPAYIGAAIFFLAVFAMFNDKRKIKYAFLAAALFALLLSWGKNFSVLTNFMIDFVPFYDKFRAVSSVQVVTEICIPVLAIMGLHSFYLTDRERRWDSLWKTAAVSFGLLIVLFAAKSLFDFVGPMDDQIIGMFNKTQAGLGDEFIQALREDRKDMYTSDLLRTGFIMALVFGILALNYKNKLSSGLSVVLVGAVILFDLVSVDKRYVDTKEFVSSIDVRQPFPMTEADREILQDTSIYRVYDVQGRLQGRSSYYHKTVGGYSAVRPRRMDQIFEYIVDKQLRDFGSIIDPETLQLTKNLQVLNALNVKYLLLPSNDGQYVPVSNPFANGPAWFVQKAITVNSADEEIRALEDTNLKTTAVISSADLKIENPTFAADSVAKIEVKLHKPNHIIYKTNNTREGLAVFSEMYYPNGWNAYVNGKEAKHFRVNYVLRGMKVPAGANTIEFKFEPQVVKTGGTIALISTILMLILLVAGICIDRRKTQTIGKTV
jgi:hypothetical protein